MTAITLPAALGRIAVRPLGEMNTRNGVAYRAEVLRDGRVAGTIENDGNGGGTWFHHSTYADCEWWNAAAEEFIPQAEVITNAEFAEMGLPPIEGVGNSAAAECLADVLYDLAVRG